MLSGDLPSREGDSTNVNCSEDRSKVLVEINGTQEELSVTGAVALIGKLAAMVEVMLYG